MESEDAYARTGEVAPELEREQHVGQLGIRIGLPARRVFRSAEDLVQGTRPSAAGTRSRRRLTSWK